jgi:hypothetical protein
MECRKATLTNMLLRGIGLLCAILAWTVMSPAQERRPSPDVVNFKSLLSFDGTNGGNPYGTLVQGTDGKLVRRDTRRHAEKQCEIPGAALIGRVPKLACRVRPSPPSQ